ncbi:hypothetical protein O6482_26150, partial [Salmonella enterica subsp. enterica]
NLFVKSKKWEYEEEFRLVSSRTGAHEFPASALKSVTMGLKSDINFIKRVEKILSTPDYAHVKLNFLQHKTGSFEFEITGICNS